jgi:Zn finger protein HypA/HybF involved in hydrogenase expression
MNAVLQRKTSILRCANCGALLSVPLEAELFGCKHCAAEMVVVRQDETTTLKCVAETLQRVDIGPN